MNKTRILIMGAAGRDFHNFNTVYRDDPNSEVIAFTATQIPNIEGRRYPPELSGDLYPHGIPIYDEKNLAELITDNNIDDVVFSYSDISHEFVMHRASEVIKIGANFKLLGSEKTMIKSSKPVVAICAVRTGSGKSQTTRRVAEILKEAHKQIAVIRHPMPYGNLVKQKVQRFSTIEDLKIHNCTIEEMEEYEPHIVTGSVVYAGVDYHAILDEAEKEADVILWDGGNNDLPFYKPDLFIVVVDPHRPGHELAYFPGESNFRMADVIIINKIDTAEPHNVDIVMENILRTNSGAMIIKANSPVTLEDPSMIAGKRCLIVEDGPTVTHGEMKYGAGTVAAKKFGASEIIDPRPWIFGTITKTFEKYPEIGILLPAMGYGGRQIKDLEQTINAVDCDLVVIGTPIDLRRIITINKPSVRVTYNLEEIGSPNLEDALSPIIS